MARNRKQRTPEHGARNLTKGLKNGDRHLKTGRLSTSKYEKCYQLFYCMGNYISAKK